MMTVKPLFKPDINTISSLKLPTPHTSPRPFFQGVYSRSSKRVCGHRRLQLQNISFSSVTDTSHSAIEKLHQQHSYLASSLRNIDLQSLK